MKLTHAQVNEYFKHGYVVFVEYLREDLAQRGIQYAQGGRGPVHVLCCLGGRSIVEEDLGGCMLTDLATYLRGQCTLTVKKPRLHRTRAQEEVVEHYWVGQVGTGYDVGMIVGMVPILFARRVLGLFSKAAAKWALRHLGNLLASHTSSTCAELYARGQRKVQPDFLKGFPDGNIFPWLLNRDAKDLELVIHLEKPVLLGRP